MRVWIDQDLCTGDGLCTDHCPDVFLLLEDGISYVRGEHELICNDRGGRASIATVRPKLEQSVIGAALDCPGDCIFLEPDEEDGDDDDCIDAGLVEEELVGDMARDERIT